MIETLEEALKYITELETENRALREEVERYRSRNRAGRKKHNEAWINSYNDFVAKYEAGMTIMEIVANCLLKRPAVPCSAVTPCHN